MRGWQRAGMIALCLMLLLSLMGPLDFRAMAQTGQVTTTTTGDPLPPPGKVIVVLRDDMFTAASDDIAGDAGVEPTHVYDTVLNGFSADVSASELQALAKDPAVASISIDYPVHAFAEPVTDHIKRVALDTYPPAAIDGVDTPVDVDIAILDTGVDRNHPDLNVVGGVSCIGSDPDAWGKGASGKGSHGTHVAGIAAAKDDGVNSGGRSVVGSAPGARIWSYKVLDDNGNGNFSNIICGLNAAAANGSIDVINMSLGGSGFPIGSCTDGSLHEAVCNAANTATIVVAAGNESMDAGTTVPAMYPEVLSVANVADTDGVPGNDALAGTSNFGSVVDIAAPGTSILSTYPGGAYARLTGTSMASPLVAGAVALYLANGGGDPRGWLLSDAASKPRNSTVGYTGPDTGTNRMLYFGSVLPPDVVTTPPPTAPAFSGFKMQVNAGSVTPDATSATPAFDRNVSTVWYSQSTTPLTTTLRLDLLAGYKITGINWRFGDLTSADKYTVKLTGAYGGSLTSSSYGNGASLSTRYGFAVPTQFNARYVDFTFANPNNDVRVGGIAEIEVWIAEVAPGVANPTFAGSKIAGITCSDTPVSIRAPLACDGNLNSNWYATGSNQTTATLKLDLGQDRILSGVKWRFSTIENAPLFSVKVTATNGTTQTFGPFGDGLNTITWYGFVTNTNVTARYVEFVFTNLSGGNVIGSIAEAEVWMQPVPVTAPGAVNPTFAGSKAGIAGSSDTPVSNRSGLARDGNADTSWYANGSGQQTATLTFDLGSDRSLSGVKWQFGSLGKADLFSVKVTDSGGNAKTYGPFGNGLATNTWYGVPINTVTNARYVEFTFQNLSGGSQIGSIAEVEIWEVIAPANPVVYPPGTKNPVFSGSKVTPVGAVATQASWSARGVIDGNPVTNYSSGDRPNGVVTLTIDLGREVDISGVKWMTTFNGYADQFRVRGVTSNYRSMILGTYGNPGASRTWYGVAVTSPTVVRWIKIDFYNPNFDRVVGSIGEVDVWEKGASIPTPTPTPAPPGPSGPGGVREPQFDGQQAQIVGLVATMSSWNAKLTYDGNPVTNWTSGTMPDGTVILTYDLGTERDISGVKWLVTFNGYADSFIVRAMDSNYRSTTLGSFGNPGAARVFYGVPTTSTVKGRWIKFYFANPNGDRVVGSIGEVEIWARDAGSAETPTPAVPDNAGTSNPTFSGAKLPIVSSTATSNSWQSDKTYDGSPASNWASSSNTPESATLTYDLGADVPITGVKWQTAFNGYADAFKVQGRTSGGDVVPIGEFSNPAVARTWAGVATSGMTVRYLDLVFTNPNQDALVGSIGEVEIWGQAPLGQQVVASPAASPVASPLASPEASPVVDGTPVASPVVEETPAASPEVNDQSQATPEVVAPVEPTPTEVVEEEPVAASPDVIHQSQASPEVVEPTATTEPTATETVEPTATSEPTVTVAPTAAVSQGFISGTDGDPVNCRLAPVDGEVIGSLAEGDVIEVTGPAVDGWYQVTCDGQQGYVSAEFVTLGTPTSGQPTPTTDATATPTAEDSLPDASPDSEEPTATGTTEPTTEPTATSEPEETPYPVVDTGDTEQSNQAIYASDNDPQTWWQVMPSSNPDQVRLYVDLGSVVPIDRLTLNLATWDELPYFEIWLSEDAETWYNATPQGINGWNLERDVDLVIDLGFDARYVRIVIPNVPDSGLTQVGGIRQVEIWPGDINQTQYLSALGQPTTPTPEPVAPTATEVPDEVIEPTTTAPDEILEPTATTAPEEPAGDGSGEPQPGGVDVPQPGEVEGTPGDQPQG